MTRFPLDTLPFIGIPYVDRGRTLQGCDCWGLLWLVYAAIGIDLPSHRSDYATSADADEVERLMHNNMSVWRPIPEGEEQPMDGILLKLGRYEHHVGIVVQPGRMLHTRAGRHGSVIDRYHAPEFKQRVVGFYRHERLLSASV